MTERYWQDENGWHWSLEWLANSVYDTVRDQGGPFATEHEARDNLTKVTNERRAGFTFRGYCISARPVRQPSGRSTATVIIHEGKLGDGAPRYAANLIEQEFDTDALAKDNALRIACAWINERPLD